MIAPMILAAVLIGGDVPPVASTPAAKSEEMAAYREVRSRTGRDSASQVRLALWCEAHGLDAERLKHLAMAALADPSNAVARSLMGLVAFRGQWRTPEAVRDRIKADEAYNAALSEYNARRARLANTADAHWKLALWCDEKGLKPEATAHLSVVVQLDPGREAAWRRLGYKKVKGRWATEAQVAAAKAEADAQKAADRHWKPILVKWRAALTGKDAARRQEAARALASLTDPRAVPSLWLTFAISDASSQKVAAQTLGQIDSPGATRALAILAVTSDEPEVRSMANSILQRRDPRDFLDLLIGMIREPIKYQVKSVGGPGSPGALFVNGKQFNLQRLYQPPAMPDIPLFPGEPIGIDPYGLPFVTRFLGNTTNVVGQQTLSVTAQQYFGGAPAGGEAAKAIQAARSNPSNPQQFTPTVQRWYAAIPLPGNRFRREWEDIATPAKYVGVTINQVTSAPFANNVQIPIGQIAMEYQKSAISAQEQLRLDVAAVESYNADVRAGNDRVLPVLGATTGISRGDDQESWRAWWVDAQGYSYNPPPDEPPPTYVEDVPLPYYPRPVYVPTTRTQIGPTATSTSANTYVDPSYQRDMVAAGNILPPPVGHACFRAGTPVQMIDRLLPIERIRAGDQVLTLEPRSGTMAYQPVVAVYHNKPSELLAIDLGGETIGATPIHRFWKSGHGWTMARDLRTGDLVRTLKGSVRVGSIEPLPTQPVFNLKVASGESFFVGRTGILVHDNSLVLPVDRAFDSAPDLKALADRSAARPR